MRTSPAQVWARSIGWTLLIGGAIGFAYSSGFGTPGGTGDVFGIFAVNGSHNLLHIVSGGLGIAMARSWSSARSYALLLAVAYTVLAIWGFIVGDGGALASVIPVDTADNVLHACIAVVSAAFGLGASAAPAPSSREAGPGFRYN